MPFHAAEQRNKEQKNDSAEHEMRLSEASALCEQYPSRGYKLREAEGQENGCTFFAASLLVRFFMQVVCQSLDCFVIQ